MLAQRPVYPPTPQGVTVDTLHGTAVADPYRWLEELESVPVNAWVHAQRAVSSEWLSKLAQRDAFRARLTTLWNYPRVSVPQRLQNGVLFYRRNSGLQKQSEIVAQSSASTNARVIIDPNALSPDGQLAVTQFAPSPTGRFVAFAVSQAGEDWEEVRVRDVRTGRDLDDRVEWVRFSALSWTMDSKGFFYSRYPSTDVATRRTAQLRHHALYYHRVGTAQSADILVYERPDLPDWFVGGAVSEDGQYLFVYLSQGADARNRLYAADLGTPTTPNISAQVTPVVERDDAEYAVVGNVGSTVFVRTDLGAPNRRVLSTDLKRPSAPERWHTVVSESATPLTDVALAKGYLLISTLDDVVSHLRLVTLEGKPAGTVALPGPGTVAAISASVHSASFYYSFTSPLVPTTTFRYTRATRQSTPFHPPTVAFDATPYETRREFAISKDGTRIPVFVTQRRGAPRNNNTPTLLYAYGGFGVNLQPSFSPAVIAWIEAGGAYATASLRGGAEYGESWHRAGMLNDKQNVFDDYIAAAKHLIQSGVTSSAQLGAIGGSNGGLLVGAMMTQQPDLFRVAVPQVGVLDMLRYHRFTGGAAWATEYGSPDDPDAFRYLVKYSPLHNVRPGVCYPATLVVTADRDDRVVPAHSYKFTAALQAAQGCERPILLRVESMGSHGYRPTDKLIEESADTWAFAAEYLGLRRH